MYVLKRQVLACFGASSRSIAAHPRALGVRVGIDSFFLTNSLPASLCSLNVPLFALRTL